MLPRTLLASFAVLSLATLAAADDWPQWLGPKRDGVWREAGIAAKFPAGGPKVRWRTPIGEGYSGPSVANGKVYVTDRVRAKGVENPKSAFDKKSKVAGVERLLCLNEADGKVLWQKEYDCQYQVSYAAGPRSSPTGKILWSKNLRKAYNTFTPTWGYSGQLLLDGDRLICLVGGQGSVAVALHKDTGKEIWKSLSAGEPGYAPPMIYEIGGKRQLILWHPDSINSLHPETGAVYWSHRYHKNKSIRAGMSIPTPRQIGDKLFFTCFYDGCLLLETRGTEQPGLLWQKTGRSELAKDTDGLHSVMVTPAIKDGYIYGVCSYGELRCLDLKTGERLWSTHKPVTGESVRWGNAFIVEQGDRFILFNELGDLVIAKFSPKGYEEIDRANILPPTNTMAPPQGRRVIWSHPAFANRSVYARNDREIVCVSMAD
ncbi:MAG: PQQ-binding-like beta-propeller repeat protein [Planctomycetes bacterium]|nr:PQQ-binding-like beta-propeller repeat protein [Planctomycetota bacterium]